MTPALSLGSAVVASDQVAWSYGTSRAQASDGAEAAPREEFGEMGALIERAEQTARNLGRSRAEGPEAARPGKPERRGGGLEAAGGA